MTAIGRARTPSQCARRVAVWPRSLRRDLLETSVVKTAVAWYCIVIGVVCPPDGRDLERLAKGARHVTPAA